MSKGKKKGKGRIGVRKSPVRPESGLPTPPPNQVGQVIGKAFGEILKRKVAQSQQRPQQTISNPLLRPETQVASPPLPTLGVRTPDAQYVLWEKREVNPQDAGFTRDPLVTRISVPTEASWTWRVSSVISVVAVMNWHTGEYKVSVPFAEPLKRISGTAVAAKEFAEALLSAADWKLSHKVVLGDAVDNLENWKDYNNE